MKTKKEVQQNIQRKSIYNVPYKRTVKKIEYNMAQCNHRSCPHPHPRRRTEEK